MVERDFHSKPFDQATVTKLDIFEKYLESWLPVFIHSPFVKTINICDFFAGTGCDSKGIPGSPLRSLNIINKFRGQIDPFMIQKTF
jgi:three-Cys-motif partner protein